MHNPIYNFDKVIERRNTDSVKWDGLDPDMEDKNLLPVWVADMDFETAPEIIAALHKRIDHGIFGYTQTPRLLFELAAEWTQRRYGYPMLPEALTTSPGVVPSLNFLVKTLTKENEKIIIQPPVYGPFYTAISNNNRTILKNPLIEEDGQYTIDFDDLDAKSSGPKTKWLIFCNPHNPVGRVWTRDELERLAEICLKNNIRIICDEIWRDLTFEGYRHIPFASLSKAVEDITITLFSITKTFNLAGISSSFAHLPRKAELKAFKGAIETLEISSLTPFNLTAMKAALAEGEPWLSALIEYLQGNMDCVESYFKENPSRIRFVRPEGTYLAWLDFRAYGMPQEKLEKAMKERCGLVLTGGTFFGDEGEGFLRLNVACPRSLLREALDRLSKF